MIESKIKPTKPWGHIAQTAFGVRRTAKDRGGVLQSIVAIGRQDIDPEGLEATRGIRIRSASSDHLVLESTDQKLPIGAEVTFQLNYSALLRAMTSPYVGKLYEHLGQAKSPLQGSLQAAS